MADDKTEHVGGGDSFEERLMKRFDRFEAKIRHDLRAVGDRLDVVAVELNKMRVEARNLDRRMSEIEHKSAQEEEEPTRPLAPGSE